MNFIPSSKPIRPLAGQTATPLAAPPTPDFQIGKCAQPAEIVVAEPAASESGTELRKQEIGRPRVVPPLDRIGVAGMNHSCDMASYRRWAGKQSDRQAVQQPRVLELEATK